MGTMAESLSDLGAEESGNIASVIFDTMGIYWTMKYKNVKDAGLLDEWGLKAKNIPMRVFAPFGYYQEYKDKGVEVDSEFAIKISELEPSDWVTLFELKFTDTIAVVIESVISELRESKQSYGFENIYDLINLIEHVEQEVKILLRLCLMQPGHGKFLMKKRNFGSRFNFCWANYCDRFVYVCFSWIV